MAARFRGSHKGIGELLRSRMIQTEMIRRGEKIKAVAESVAPVGTPPGDPHPGLYKGSIMVTSTSHGGRKRDRATATVTNRAYYARWLEYGSEKTPARHVMLRAAQSGGRD